MAEYSAYFHRMKALLSGLLLAGLMMPAMPLHAASPSPSSFSSPPVTMPGGSLCWSLLEPGLALALLAEAHSSPKQGHRITVLRIDPGYYDFCLYSTAWDRTGAMTIGQWAETQNLTAAINAGMYLPDGHTSTGYMRRGEAHNNSRIAEKYGGFFVCGPRRPDLPGAAVLDRTVDDWERLLPNYDVVVQNFRLMGPHGEQTWPEDGPAHAIAAIGMNAAGHILFLHCRDAISVHRFVEILNAHPELDISAAIYVEGGSQAAMALRLPGFQQVWAGRNAAEALFGGDGSHLTLPNIIGIRPRAQQTAKP